MKLVFVVQRYGVDVAGGAEALARSLAERLVRRGHDVCVITSAARDYSTWEDSYTPGVSELNGVEVNRLSVAAPRDPERFSVLSARVADPSRRSASAQQSWMIEQGPLLSSFVDTLRAAASTADVVAFFTYLYTPTYLGMEALDASTAAILHPTAHDEWPMRLPIIRSVFDRADGLAFSTPEEADLVALRFRPSAPQAVIGIGFDPRPGDAPDIAGFRQRYGLGDDRYVVCLGRVDPNKGSDEAIAYFQESQRRGLNVRLVMAGAEMMPILHREGLVVTGYLDEPDRWAAIAGAEVVLQPSRQESFGMTLAEGWQYRRPAMVQRACDVTTGLVERSGGGLAYSTWSEFDATLHLLLERPDLRARLGASGSDHVASEYTWDVVLDRYEELVEWARSRAAG